MSVTQIYSEIDQVLILDGSESEQPFCAVCCMVPPPRARARLWQGFV